MPQYDIFLGGDGNWYYRKTTPMIANSSGVQTAFAVAVSGPFATYALARASFVPAVFADTGWSEVAS